MKITALLVLKPSSSGARGSSSMSSGGGSGPKALVLANATDVSHFSYPASSSSSSPAPSHSAPLRASASPSSTKIIRDAAGAPDVLTRVEGPQPNPECMHGKWARAKGQHGSGQRKRIRCIHRLDHH